MVFPFAAGADKGGASPKHGPRPATDGDYVTPDLQKQANANPGNKVRVIIQSSGGLTGADKALKIAVPGGPSARKNLDLVSGVAVEIPAGKLNALLKIPGLTITPDSPVHLSDYSSTQLWPHYTGNDKYWPTNKEIAAGYNQNAPTIAIVDSGIDANRPDFDYGKRIAAQVNLTSLPNNSPGDGRGHGTFVAGVAAGSAAKVTRAPRRRRRSSRSTSWTTRAWPTRPT